MTKSLVIVESPTKAKTISKFLPKGYIVKSSMGHIRDLPSSAAEIPEKFKGEKWANLGVNVDNDFEPLYVIPKSKKKVVTELKKALKEADELILATDEDREGEAISWHLLEILKPKVPVKRMVFHEITKSAIEEALENFRDIDQGLVDAQEARRLLDRLAGYTISPVLWKKIAPKLSAGRVQSVAVALLVQKERERLKFKSASYWDLKAMFSKDKTDFEAIIERLNDKKVAKSKDFNKDTGKLSKPKDVILLNEKEAKDLNKDIKDADFKVSNVEHKQQTKSPAPPFITSTLQQIAASKLNLPARQTMRIAQSLYENGLITYMRTDSTSLSKQAISAAQKVVESEFGKEFLHSKTRVYKSKSKNAQLAHEAIRPSGNKFKHPKETGLSGKDLALYDLIWKRTIATQMADAKITYTNAEIETTTKKNNAVFKASGKTIDFPGFLKAYNFQEKEEAILPILEEGNAVDLKELSTESHETKPPGRYTEASLIKALEKFGIGRPSTYASIIGTIQDRGYVEKKNNALVPTFTAFGVTQLLENHFPDLVDTTFTASMEDSLDEIAHGKETWLHYIKDYYKGKKGIRTQVDTVEKDIEPTEARKIDISVEKGVEILIGRFGPYVKKGEESASIPVEYSPSDINEELVEKILTLSAKGDSEESALGKDPVTGENVYIKIGRFGPYVQLGEVTDDNKKPKRSSLLKGMKEEDVDLKLALKLLEIPRNLGNHPDTGKEVKAGVGRFGPYIVHDGDFRSLRGEDSVLDIDLKRALEILAEEKKKGKRGAQKLKSIGKDPGSGEEIELRDGRYGPYLKVGKKNYSVPKDMKVEDVTLEKAVEIIKSK